MTTQFAATSLAEIGDTYVERELLEVVEETDMDGQARGQAAFVLGKIGDEETAEQLDSVLDSTEDEQVRKQVFSALSKLGGRRN
jgi:HEAT repeat protein